MATVHLLKLSVGTEDVAGLAAWQASRQAQSRDGYPQHVTRMWPKREAEISNGGSIFWVIKGVIQCRQRIIRLGRADRCRRHPALRDCQRPAADPRRRNPKTRLPRLALSGRRRRARRPARRRASEESLPPELSKALAAIGVR